AVELYIGPGGRLRCLYGEALDLATLGRPQIVRASFVEPDGRGRWHADLAPVGGPTLGPFAHRSEALAAEAAWLTSHAFGDEAPGACRGDHDPIGPRGGPLMRTTATVMLIRRGLRWLGRRPTAERLARAAR